MSAIGARWGAEPPPPVFTPPCGTTSPARASVRNSAVSPFVPSSTISEYTVPAPSDTSTVVAEPLGGSRRRDQRPEPTSRYAVVLANRTSSAIEAPPARNTFNRGARTDACTIRTRALPAVGRVRSSLRISSPSDLSAYLPTPATVYARPSTTATTVVSTGGDEAGAPFVRIATVYCPAGRA